MTKRRTPNFGNPPEQGRAMRTVYGVPSFDGFMELAANVVELKRAKRRQQRVVIPAEVVERLRALKRLAATQSAAAQSARTRRMCFLDLEDES